MAVHCVIRNFRLTFPAAKHCPQNASSSNLQHKTRPLAEIIQKPEHSTHLQEVQQARSLATHVHSPQKRSRLNTGLRVLSIPSPTNTRTMASDSDYMAFLDKANRQRDAGRDQPHAEFSAPSQQTHTETVQMGVNVPDVLKKVNSYYISETDEPFEPVALKWEGASRGTWPGKDQFASLITGSSSASSNISQSIETISPIAFDPRNQYTGVIKAVRAAATTSDPSVDESGIDVKVYRVEVGYNRVEYWILALDAADGKIVGLKAKAIES